MTSRWGPLGWITLHSISANYPESPTQADKMIVKKFLDLFADTITCPSCKNHFGIMYQSYIVKNPGWANNRASLFLFVCRAHNTVNARLDKPKVQSVRDSIDTLKALTRITSPTEYRNQYLAYLQRNWSQPNPEGFMMSAAVREMIKINNEYWNLRETNFNIHLPEDNVLQYISPTRGPNSRPLPGITSSGTPVKVGFSLKSGRFSLIGH
jgi:FAD-linked sulfhydryl oxidase